MRIEFITSKLLISGFIFFLLSSLALANGKFYYHETIPNEIPYQRALLLFDGENEILLLQSKYKIQNPNNEYSFGWVVPVPAVPNLASMTPEQADRLFYYLESISQPDIIYISDMVFFFLLGISIIAIVIANRKRSAAWIKYSLYIFLVFLIFIGLLYMPLLSPSVDNLGGVEVIKAERVGIYDVKVIKSDDNSNLVEWFDQNGYMFDKADIESFDNYIKLKWCFVTARIHIEEDNSHGVVSAEGLVAPLIIRFPTEKAIYPLVLTASIGKDTKLLLYTVSLRKMESDRRLEMQYACSTVNIVREIQTEIKSPLFWSSFLVNTDNQYLTKFKGILTPSQMGRDLKLTFSQNNETYRKNLIKW